MIVTNAPDGMIPRAPSGSGRERSTAKEGTVTVTMPIAGADADDKKAWFSQQIEYENLATNEAIRDRAFGFAQASIQRFRSAIQPIHEKWKVVNHAMRGNTFSGSVTGREPIHVPELYTLEETLIPRLEEAMFHYPEWFYVIGREDADKAQERTIQRYLMYQLQRSRWQDLVHPGFRTMLRYGVAPFKVFWSLETRDAISRTVNVEYKDDKVTYSIKREEKAEVTFNGPRVRLIEPECFMVDVDAMSVQDCRFVGDTTTMTFDQIAMLGEQGLFANWQELAKAGPRTDPMRDQVQQSRGPEMSSLPRAHIEGGSRIFSVTELWGEFDAFDTGRTREFVITIANDSVVMRVQENPHDDKHRPYATWRAAREPFKFFNVAPFDQAVPLQLELDEHRNLAADSHRLTVSPYVHVDQNSDIPDSLLGVLPGKVFRGNGVPTFIKAPSTLQDALAYNAMLRQNLEECVGAPRIMQGTEGGNTATEIERKLQEGNKRSIGYIRAATNGCEQMLRIMHALNQQYVTKEDTFRVLGAAGQKIKVYDEVNPAVLDVDVDFEFLGPSNLQTVGMRATQIQQFLTIIYPLIQAQPNLIDIPKLIADLFDAMVGTRLSAEVVRVPQALDEMMDPELENILLLQGQQVPIHEGDNDVDHNEKHAPLLTSEKFKELSPHAQSFALQHMMEHENQRRQKAVMEAAKEKQMPGFATNQQMQELPAERGTTGTRGPQGSAPNAGETNGPPGQFGTRSPDRKGGMFQTENQTA